MTGRTPRPAWSPHPRLTTPIAQSRHPMLFSCQVAGEGFLLSGCGWSGGLVGECGFLVVVLAGGQAVPEAAEEASEEVALGGGVPVAVAAAAVVVGAGAG